MSASSAIPDDERFGDAGYDPQYDVAEPGTPLFEGEQGTLPPEARRVLTLPMYAGLTEEEVDMVCDAVIGCGAV
jgi:hypothetical protein